MLDSLKSLLLLLLIVVTLSFYERVLLSFRSCSCSLSSQKYPPSLVTFRQFRISAYFVCLLSCIYFIRFLNEVSSTSSSSSPSSTSTTTIIYTQFEFFFLRNFSSVGRFVFSFLENNYGYYNFYLLFEVKLFRLFCTNVAHFTTDSNCIIHFPFA